MSSASQLMAVISRLTTAPSVQPYVMAARVAAARASAEFAKAGVPLKATVTTSGHKVNISILQLGPLTRPFGATTPVQLLRQYLLEELPDANTDLLDRILRAVS